VVILPIYRNDEEQSQVLAYCAELKSELEQQHYDGGPVRVFTDDRDIRGGQKKWDHIKRGVPVRVEVGPRDVGSNSVFMARRDEAKSNGVPRDEFVANIATTLSDIQNTLLARADALRKEHTREIDGIDEFRAFFTPQNSDKPEIHGGFAICHWTESPEMDEILKELKVTIRCVPLEEVDRPTAGTCIFTGKPSQGRAVFAKSY
jgi:prolyl-tRNA synthetase